MSSLKPSPPPPPTFWWIGRNIQGICYTRIPVWWVVSMCMHCVFSSHISSVQDSLVGWCHVSIFKYGVSVWCRVFFLSLFICAIICEIYLVFLLPNRIIFFIDVGLFVLLFRLLFVLLPSYKFKLREQTAAKENNTSSFRKKNFIQIKIAINKLYKFFQRTQRNLEQMKTDTTQ